MKKYFSLFFIAIVALSICACSDGSHWRGEDGAALREEARIEQELYEMEQYKKAYNDGGQYAVYCFEGILDSMDGIYMSGENFQNLIDSLEEYYGGDIAYDIRDLIVDYAHDSFSTEFEEQFNSLRNEFK